MEAIKCRDCLLTSREPILEWMVNKHRKAVLKAYCPSCKKFCRYVKQSEENLRDSPRKPDLTLETQGIIF